MRVRVAALVVVVAALAMTGCSASSGPQPTSTRTRTPGAPLIVAVGNSFVGGSAMDSGPDFRWPALVADAVGANVDVVAAGASGYLDPGDGGLVYRDLVSEIPADADVVIVMGSDDDEGRSEEDIRAAAVEALRIVGERAPHAALIVASTPWVEADPREGIVATRDAVAQAAADVGAVFVDSLAEGWLVTGPAGQIGADGLHPTDLGHARIAATLIPVVRQALADR